MEILKMNLAQATQEKQEPIDIKDHMKIIKEKREKLELLRERSRVQVADLEGDIQKLEKKSFDMIVRKVIDSGLVYMDCPHKDIKERESEIRGMRFNIESRLSRHVEHRRISNTDPFIQKQILGSDRIHTYGDESGSIFYGFCKKCDKGVNRHDCSVEGETYFFTCDEARVVNNVARQYGVRGSIHTATQIQD